MDTQLQTQSGVTELRSVGMPNAGELQQIEKLCGYFVASGYLPKGVDTVAKAVTIALYSRALGLDLAIGFNQIHVINGKPTMGASMMLARVRKAYPSAVFHYARRDAQCCTLVVEHQGVKTTFQWTIEDARRAGLFGNATRMYEKFPTHMLSARTTRDACVTLFPDALNGIIYTPEDFDRHESFIGSGETTPQDPPSAGSKKPPRKSRTETMAEQLGGGAPDATVPIQDAELVDDMTPGESSPENDLEQGTPEHTRDCAERIAAEITASIDNAKNKTAAADAIMARESIIKRDGTPELIQLWGAEFHDRIVNHMTERWPKAKPTTGPAEKPL